MSTYGNLFGQPYRPVKPKVFVSYHHDNDQRWYDQFTRVFADAYDLVTDRSLGACVESDDCEYVMRVIREQYLTGTSVTIVLCGNETWKRCAAHAAGEAIPVVLFRGHILRATVAVRARHAHAPTPVMRRVLELERLVRHLPAHGFAVSLVFEAAVDHQLVAQPDTVTGVALRRRVALTVGRHQSYAIEIEVAGAESEIGLFVDPRRDALGRKVELILARSRHVNHDRNPVGVERVVPFGRVRIGRHPEEDRQDRKSVV